MDYLQYTKLAKYYDKIYHYIDFGKQSKFIKELIIKFNKPENKKLLDACCGTGNHINVLKQDFEVTGFDISRDMLKKAKEKNPEINFIQCDMRELNLNEKFGTILCFFNSILYNKNEEEMKKTISNFYTHLEDGGILIFDTIDKSIGINSKKEEYAYQNEDEIIFKPQWIFNQKENVIYLDNDFIINGEKIHDLQKMGAFSFDELQKILENIGFEVFILDRGSLEPINNYYTSHTAIFVCRK